MTLWTNNDCETDGEVYISDEGEIIERVFDGETPTGNSFWGQWGYFDVQGNLLDYDQYRHDLFERNNIDFMNMAKVYHTNYFE